TSVRVQSHPPRPCPSEAVARLAPAHRRLRRPCSRHDNYWRCPPRRRNRRPEMQDRPASKCAAYPSTLISWPQGWRAVRDRIKAELRPRERRLILKQRPQQAIVERVTRLLAFIETLDLPAREKEVADHVEQLVAHELIRRLKPACIQHGVALD